ncbi:phage portal protein [Cellulomonas hominis]|uniref:Phage portal protein n=1 Tax=Cellulomonas hominis TaxID=156981 RepID=A0A7Z8K3E9_9CELL|nr:phage portal protein [Cellulomonas hominis]TKR27143.1 phage portal protein [Cellulomonas hominis]
MPLPQPGTKWPPEPFDVAFDAMRAWDAWYVGDTAALARTYRGRPANRPSQLRGGVVGAAARFFWGRPVPDGEPRTRLHVPVPSDLATTSADLLFSEPPRIVMPGGRRKAGRTPRQERLEEIANSAETHTALLEAAELGTALGGTYLRIVWDATDDGPDLPLLTAVHADGAIPTWRWGQLDSVVFWTIVGKDGQTVFRHVEHHEHGRIQHALYQGTESSIGHVIPLAEHTKTQWLVPLVDADSAIETGSPGLTAGYVPNIRPSRRWRHEAELAPLGRSDFDGLEPLFDALDETYSSWMRDIRLAKARLLVDQGAMTSLGPGAGAAFDVDQEVFTQVPGIGSMKDGRVAQAEQFAIRHEEHKATADELLRAILRGAKYSPQTFGDDATAVSTTATEVKAREKLSERTRDKKARYWASELGRLSAVLLDVDAAVFRGPGSGGDLPEARFPPKVQEDTLELAQTAQALRTAEAASVETRVRLVHPDWDGDTVNTEVDKIMREYAIADPATLRPDVEE